MCRRLLRGSDVCRGRGEGEEGTGNHPNTTVMRMRGDRMNLGQPPRPPRTALERKVPVCRASPHGGGTAPLGAGPHGGGAARAAEREE